MIPQAKTLYAEIHRIHGELHQRIAELSALTDGTSELGELADICYAMREADKLNNDTGVSIRKVQTIAAKRFCLAWVVLSNTGEKVQTPYCTATPDLKICVSPPKMGTPEYAVFMASMGIPENIWKPEDTPEAEKKPPIKFDYEGLCDWLTDQQARGKPLPAGVTPQKTYNEFAVSVRKRKSIIEEAPTANAADVF